MFVFLDTETTGIADKDRLCQLAYITDNGTKVNKYFKPGGEQQISIDAMCVHHITNEMVEGLPTFQESADYQKLIDLLNNNNIIVAHNAKFDISMLQKEGIKIDRYICTLKLARFLDKNGMFDKHNLQFLNYTLKLYKEIEGKINAHDALGDVIVLEKLFYRLYHSFFYKEFPDAETKKLLTKEIKNSSDINIEGPNFYAEFFKKNLTESYQELAIQKMIEISLKPSLLYKISFGKHKGTPFNAIPKDYLQWLEKQSDLDEDLQYTIKYYLAT
ncbi:MAG: 3'-5' exonuclease [Desulfamplus sp.]|nr:3'-5' exonuclease [Desulfamplus sp.]